jgi:hypothetical protein
MYDRVRHHVVLGRETRMTHATRFIAVVAPCRLLPVIFG